MVPISHLRSRALIRGDDACRLQEAALLEVRVHMRTSNLQGSRERWIAAAIHLFGGIGK